MFKEWLRQRREDKAQKVYERGYGWAAVRILVHGENPDTVCPDTYFDRTEFDKGAQRACFDLSVMVEKVRVRSGKIRRPLQ
jgi:hypothetical protein